MRASEVVILQTDRKNWEQHWGLLFGHRCSFSFNSGLLPQRPAAATTFCLASVNMEALRQDYPIVHEYTRVYNNLARKGCFSPDS